MVDPIGRDPGFPDTSTDDPAHDCRRRVGVTAALDDRGDRLPEVLRMRSPGRSKRPSAISKVSGPIWGTHMIVSATMRGIDGFRSDPICGNATARVVRFMSIGLQV